MKIFLRSHPLTFSCTLTLTFLILFGAVACNRQPQNTDTQDGGRLILPNGSVATPTAQTVADEPAAVPDGLQIVWEAYSILVTEYLMQEKICLLYTSDAADE